jgi:hypothetical protein
MRCLMSWTLWDYRLTSVCLPGFAWLPPLLWAPWDRRVAPNTMSSQRQQDVVLTDSPAPGGGDNKWWVLWNFCVNIWLFKNKIKKNGFPLNAPACRCPLSWFFGWKISLCFCWIFIYLSISLVVLELWASGFAKKGLYHLNHISNPFCFRLFFT